MKAALFFLFVVISVKPFSQTSDPPPPPPPLSGDSLDMGTAIFEKVDVEATFSGGERAWRKYLEQNLNPNVPVENGAPIGIYMVVVQFIVDKSGAVSDIKALTNFGYGMEQEVIRIMKQSPVWTPANQNHRTVKAYRKQPITFVVEDEAVEIIMNEKYVLYTATDNILKISVYKVKKEDLELSLSQGKVVPGDDGNFHIHVNNPGKAILYINSKKRNKQIGSVYFVVKKKA